MSHNEEEPVGPPEGVTDVATQRYDAEIVARAQTVLSESPGQIGPYRILERLGGGGMGEVYRAEQRAPIRRDVALKLIKLGMDTKLVIARFEAERQALAMMDHPHIAKVFDAGTEATGRPYFIMEYVKGRPITDYADQNHLSIEERLELFEQVCHAVQHAHHKGIIHRDLKPSNVLVSTQDGKAFAKVIDFGIAKATAQRLTDLTLYTQHEQLLGTPQYMSPEQAEGSLDIDTRTDVYSLGVLLYELLTGSTPFGTAELKAAAVEQLKRMICEVDPPKPSTRISMSQQTLPTLAASRRTEPKKLGVLVRGELDWIVMKSLEKDRARRYDTPTSLAEDVNRYLTGQPVVAAPPSWRYRARKFVRRYKGPVFAASTIAAILVLGIAGTVWQASVAIRERNNAEAASAREAARADSEAKARESAELESYIANISAAQSALASDGYTEARERLAACAESRRGWEWKFLHQRAETVVGTLPVGYRAQGFTKDGKRMAVVARDNTVQWRDATGHPLGEPMSAGANVTVRLSDDGRQLATASHDGQIGLWDPEGHPIHALTKTGESWEKVEFSPDGTKVLTTTSIGDDEVQEARLSVWNLNGERIAGPRKLNKGLPARFSADGKRIVTSYIENFDVEQFDLNLKPLGKPIAGAFIAEREQEFASFSPDGTRAFRLHDGQVTLLELNGNSIAVLADKKDRVWKTAEFTSDGRFLLTGSDGTGIVWDREGKQVGGRVEGNGEFQITRDGAKLVYFDKQISKLAIRDLASDVTTYAPCENHHRLAFSPNGKLWTWSRDSVRVWDTAGQPVSDIMRPGMSDNAYSMPVFSSDGSRIVSPMVDAGQRGFGLWEASGKYLGFFAHDHSYCEPRFSPDAKHVLLEPSGEAPTLIVANESFATPISKFEVGAGPTWEIERARSLARKERKTPEPSNGVSALGRSDESPIPGMPESVYQRIRAQFGAPTTSAIDNSGRRLVTGGDDSTIRFWDTKSWHEVASFRMAAAIESCEFTADDSQLIVILQDESGQIWDARDALTRRRERERSSDERGAAKSWAVAYIDQILADQTAKRSWQPGTQIKKSISEDSGLEWSKRVAAFDELERRLDGYRRVPHESWELLYRADSPPAEVQAKLARLEIIAGLLPTNRNQKNLAAAQYRAGRYQESLQTLKRAAHPLSQWTPLFQAMASFKLGDKEAAKKYLDEAKARRDQWGISFTSHAVLFEEAEAMIEPTGKPASTPEQSKPETTSKSELR